MACIMLCIDGMEERGQQTPDFPQENLLAYGKVRTAPEGALVDSLGCILRLLDTQEADIPKGRAAIEALALGIPMETNDLALRCTLCRVDERGQLAPAPENTNVAAFLPKFKVPINWTLHAMSGYRCLLRILGGADEAEELVTIPPHQHFGAPFLSCLPYGGKLGEALNNFAQQTAKIQPGFILLPWGQSKATKLPVFHTRAQMVCKAEVVRGIGIALGMDCPEILGATADVDTDLTEKYQAACHAMRNLPLTVVHVNGCDEAGHRRDYMQKMDFRARVQKQLLAPLHANLRAGDRLLVCSDHKTDSTSGAHEAGKVSFWLYEAGAETPKMYDFEDPGAPLRLLLG